MLYVRRILIGLQERARLLRRFVLAGISTKAKSLSCIDLGLLCTRKAHGTTCTKVLFVSPTWTSFHYAPVTWSHVLSHSTRSNVYFCFTILHLNALFILANLMN
jgi:hypothetical protein